MTEPRAPLFARDAEASSQGERSQAQPRRDQERGGEAVAGKRLPEVAFVEADAAAAERKAKSLYESHLYNGSSSVVVRSLGKNGTAGALAFLLELRQEGAKAAEQRDVRVRLVPRDNIPGFGAQLLMFVSTVPSRQMRRRFIDRPVTVSSRTEFKSLVDQLDGLLPNLAPGDCVTMKMVGIDNVHRGLLALSAACGRAAHGGGLYCMPDVVKERLRPSSKQKQQRADAEVAGAEGETEATELPMVDVVRLIVSRAAPRRRVEPQAPQ